MAASRSPSACLLIAAAAAPSLDAFVPSLTAGLTTMSTPFALCDSQEHNDPETSDLIFSILQDFNPPLPPTSCKMPAAAPPPQQFMLPQPQVSELSASPTTSIAHSAACKSEAQRISSILELCLPAMTHGSAATFQGAHVDEIYHKKPMSDLPPASSMDCQSNSNAYAAVPVDKGQNLETSFTQISPAASRFTCVPEPPYSMTRSTSIFNSAANLTNILGFIEDLPDPTVLQPQESELSPCPTASIVLSAGCESKARRMSTLRELPHPTHDSMTTFQDHHANVFHWEKTASSLHTFNARAVRLADKDPKPKMISTQISFAQESPCSMSCSTSNINLPANLMGTLGSVAAFPNIIAKALCSPSAPACAAEHQIPLADLMKTSVPALVSSMYSSIQNVGTPPESFRITEESGSVIDAETVKSVQKRELKKFHRKNEWKARVHLRQAGIRKRDICFRKERLTTPPYSEDGNSADGNRLVDHNSAAHEKECREVIFRVRTENLQLYDGYEWRKYGEKKIKNHAFTRNYYRCAQRKRMQCSVQKHTQRWTEDGDFVDFTYLGSHNHPPQQTLDHTDQT